MMRENFRLTVAILFMAIALNDAAAQVVFHGKDEDTGASVSRASVDTVGPGKLPIGLQVVHVHRTGAITLAFTSTEGKLKTFDTSSAVLNIDKERIPLTFKRYHAHPLGAILEPIHQLWFSALSREVVGKINGAKTLAIEISAVSGIPATRELGDQALSAVKEVIKGPSKK